VCAALAAEVPYAFVAMARLTGPPMSIIYRLGADQKHTVQIDIDQAACRVRLSVDGRLELDKQVIDRLVHCFQADPQQELPIRMVAELAAWRLEAGLFVGEQQIPPVNGQLAAVTLSTEPSATGGEESGEMAIGADEQPGEPADRVEPPQPRPAADPRFTALSEGPVVAGEEPSAGEDDQPSTGTGDAPWAIAAAPPRPAARARRRRRPTRPPRRRLRRPRRVPYRPRPASAGGRTWATPAPSPA
jgi:hypothetical protein